MFKRKRIKGYVKGALEYIKQNLITVHYSLSPKNDDDGDKIQYADRNTSSGLFLDKYSSDTVASFMKKYEAPVEIPTLLKALDTVANETFTDALIIHISKKDLQPSKVYKAAQIDRRLFSKIISDRYYTPSKDTAIAIAIALQLSLDDTSDLLSRAGYTLSHSNRRDIIIEYFIHEEIYNICDINAVLYKLGEKIIGR